MRPYGWLAQTMKIPPTLENDIQEFVDHMRVERGFSENTSSAYLRDLMQYAAWLGGDGVLTTRAITPHHVLRYAHELRSAHYNPATKGKIYAPPSVARKLAAIRSWHRFLARRPFLLSGRYARAFLGHQRRQHFASGTRS